MLAERGQRMTTERATPPAGFDTLAEARRLQEAGVPEAHGAAMLYAAIAAADARNAELRKDTERALEAAEARHAELRRETEARHAELRKDTERALEAAEARHAELRKETEARHAELRRDTARALEAAEARHAEFRKDSDARHTELRKDTEASNAELRKDTKHDIRVAQWKIIAGISLALFAASSFIIAGVKFVLEWPIG